MERKIVLLIGSALLGMLVVSSVVTAAARGGEALRKAIEAANAEWSARFNAGDSVGVAALYTKDGKLLPPNSDFVSEPSAIAKFWKGAMEAGIKGVKLETREVHGAGEMAFEVGGYSLTDAETKPLDQGKYIVIWKREEGKWKLYRDIWNTSRPASGGKN